MSDPDNPGTLLQFYQIFQSRDFWKRWLPLKIQDSQLDLWVKGTLENTDYTQTGMRGEVSVGNWVSSKFADFVLDPHLRGIFGQTRSTIDLQKIMNEGKILLINLAKGLLGEATSRFLGLVLMAKIQAEAMKRAKMTSAERQPFFLYVDEFQSLSTENFTILLSEARKFRMGLVLANQFISQIKDPTIIEAVFGNVGTYMSFRLGRADAGLIESQYLPYLDWVDLTNLPNWHAAVRTSINGWGLPPFTVKTILPQSPANPEIAAQARELSRKKYAHPRAEVDEMITRSITTPEKVVKDQMKVLVFGASRGVGLEVVRQALEAGHDVTAFVRSPGSFSLAHERLTVFEGDALDEAAVEKAIAGQDVVISTLGQSKPPVPHMLELTATNIVAGMKKHEVRRIIFTTGQFIRHHRDQLKGTDRALRFLHNLFAKDSLLDAVACAEMVSDHSLDWTLVRFPRLTDGDQTGRYRAGYARRNSGRQISRADAAEFIVKELVKRQWVDDSPLVSE